MASAVDKELIDAATRLFYERGVAATGVDTVAAVSGVSKPTLYAHFGTKAALVAAVLEEQHRQRRASLEVHLAARARQSPTERLLSVFDWIASHQSGDWKRGCPFVNASVELVGVANDPAREAIGRHKQWFRGVLACLAEEAGADDPVALASQLHLLIEGANARMLAEGDSTAIVDARRVGELLVSRAVRGSMRARGGRNRRTGTTD